MSFLQGTEGVSRGKVVSCKIKVDFIQGVFHTLCMKYLFLLVLLILPVASFAGNEEFILQQMCSKGDLTSCENLTAFYVKTSKWDNAFSLGDALCKREIMKGCTFAGTALLAKGQSKEGITFLTKSCDGFEPYACRSLARIMKQNKETLLAYMYYKRACHYGGAESCNGIKTPKEPYSAKAKEFLKKVIEDCDDQKSTACQTSLATLDKCSETLTKDDCLLIPGELSIYFRAKLLQESAKLELMNIWNSQKALKANPKYNRYSYDLRLLLQGQKARSAYIYAFGFAKACTKKFEKAKDAESTSLAIYKNSYSDVFDRSKKNVAAFFYKGKADDCYDPKFGYEAFAVASLDPQNYAKYDVWKINADGDLVHIQDGLPTP